MKTLLSYFAAGFLFAGTAVFYFKLNEFPHSDLVGFFCPILMFIFLLFLISGNDDQKRKIARLESQNGTFYSLLNSVGNFSNFERLQKMMATTEDASEEDLFEHKNFIQNIFSDLFVMTIQKSTKNYGREYITILLEIIDMLRESKLTGPRYKLITDALENAVKHIGNDKLATALIDYLDVSEKPRGAPFMNKLVGNAYENFKSKIESLAAEQKTKITERLNFLLAHYPEDEKKVPALS